MTRHSAVLYACLFLTISLRDDLTVSATEENLQSLAGQSCTTTDDCFGGNACLGSEGNKRCCAFTESNFNANNGLYKGCNSCGDETAQDIYDMVNLASVRRVNLGTLTSTDKHIQPSRFSRATMSFWGVA